MFTQVTIDYDKEESCKNIQGTNFVTIELDFLA